MPASDKAAHHPDPDDMRAAFIAHCDESLEYGWWEASVVARKNDVFTLRYRDYPSLPKFVRVQSGIALMFPQAGGASGLSRTWDEIESGDPVIAHESPP